ncbi:hypothetical protein ACWGK9_42760, partial [Streptomyces rubiginosohelvolus]
LYAPTTPMPGRPGRGSGIASVRDPPDRTPPFHGQAVRGRSFRPAGETRECAMVSAADRVENPVRSSVWLKTRQPARSRRTDQPAGLTQDEYVRQARAAIQEQPRLDGLVEDSPGLTAARGGAGVEETRERDFAVALDLLIAGIEAMVARSGR